MNGVVTMAMIPGFPDSSDFDSDKVKTYSAKWAFHRDPGLDGKNVGEDFLTPEGSVIVDFETNETSRYNTKGNPDIRIVFEDRGRLRIPKGVHVGIRLTPGNILEGGAGFTGDINMKIVSERDWYNAP